MEGKGFVIDFQSINFGGDVWNATRVENMEEEDFELYLKEMPLKSKSFAF
jgi:hypothetical protein